MVTLKSVFPSSDEDEGNLRGKLLVCLGKDTASKPMVIDLTKMPHVLVAETTGSGKSSLMNAFINSLPS